MTFEQLNVYHDGPVTTITLDRPAALNAITPQMLDELNAAVTTAINDDSQRAIVLTGTGRAFSAGVDLKALGEHDLADGAVGDILDLPARSLTEKLATAPIVTIAKVNGFCFTGALELALACDLMIVADEAKLGDTHAKFGLRPNWGMTQRLPARVGVTRARELSMTARTFTGREAAAMNLATRSVPAAELDGATAELIDAVLANSHGSLAAYKDLYRAAEQLGITDGLRYEAETDYPISDTADRLAQF